jgi:DNA repair protein SbcC/Rad50
MLERLVIVNFQTHRKLKIDFDPKITVIAGPTDSGKSSVIRALQWIAFNRPAGTAFVRHGRYRAVARLVIDGQRVVRRRGKGENSYELSGKPFKAFGSDVPGEISDVLNLSEINFQGQHDSPFWLSETAGQVGRNLNEIVNLDVIDRSMTEVSGRVREAQTRLWIAGERHRQAEDALKELVRVPEMRGELNALIDDTKATEEREEEAEQLEGLLAEITRWQEVKRNALEREKELRSIVDTVDEDKVAEAERLEHLLREIERWERKRSDHRQRAEKAEEELHRRSKGKCPLCGRSLSSARTSTSR